ncbi:HD domain-containing protein [Sulfitobacter donghicola]|uniref:Phosphohydrolase n=1 Tax=Sulfitobacter donghicola DSW-25 = KCTC 12864 = JCM 14565 TaxID=1300350 RepID=A0A073IY14_9RHOB|nr:HD domain-containing protein [Sulfitobacter donghicola]KEJ90277.1 phosphohydrolase [Sulfitobacter donghicola DSW-25 = KCTC 12864 = JCM 14565]KIN66552.1 HD domain protein YedJ [Sulfitobacter donghicola DSW-25 = KCTC 12864 = JCM 14565]
MSAHYEAEVLRVWGTQTDGAHDVWHLRRVWALAQKIAAAEGGDLEVIEAACFLHDIINPPKDSPQRAQAAALSAAHATQFLNAQGMTPNRVSMAAHAIEAHSFSAGVTPRTIEAQVVQDADRLEALGALGIARCFNVSGQMGGALFHGGDPMGDSRALDDRAYALDHFEVKLLRVAETLNTATARDMAAQRVAFMKTFRDQLLAEVLV